MALRAFIVSGEGASTKPHSLRPSWRLASAVSRACLTGLATGLVASTVWAAEPASNAAAKKEGTHEGQLETVVVTCLLYTSPSPRDS